MDKRKFDVKLGFWNSDGVLTSEDGVPNGPLIFEMGFGRYAGWVTGACWVYWYGQW